MAQERTAGDFGSKLREARERRGITLRHIAGVTKISVAALEALERNDISRLPGGIFSRAFVRSYASQVGLDPEEAVQAFIAEFPHDSVTAGHPRSAPIEDNEALESDRRTASTFLRLIVLSIPLAGVVVYFGTSGRLASHAPAEASSASAPAPPPASPPAVVAGPSAGTVAGAPATASVPAASGPTPSASTPGVPTRLTIVLSVTRPCWLSATVDGEKRIERLLQAGDARTVEVTREMSLTAGDAAAVKMTINGAEARSLGKAEEVVTAHINLTNFRSYLSR
jgi:cytoskeleton protein RodZ